MQELIDSAEILKQLHDEILAQIEKFDEVTEAVSATYPELSDDAFVRENLDRWLR